MTNDLQYAIDNLILRIKSSEINGVGLFAIKDIEKDKQLLKYHGTVQLIEFILEEEDEVYFTPEQLDMFTDYYLRKDGKIRMVMMPNEQGMLHRYLNFSNDNFNCIFKDELIIATRDISIGEEILLDPLSKIGEPFDPFFNK